MPANPYDLAEVVYRSVNTEGLVSYRQNQYSVPWRHVGQVLPIRVTEKELIVYGSDIKEIARHRLLPSSSVRQRQILSAHRPKEDPCQQDAMLQESFREFGEVGKPFLDGLLATHRYGKAQSRKILALRAHYHQKDIIKALERAVTYGAYSVSAIERILSVQAEPKTTLDTLADHEKSHLSQLLKDASVRPRETADYQKLLFEEKKDGQESVSEPEEESTDEKSVPEDVEGPDPGALPDTEGPRDGPATR
jgi:hypothetical protein